MYFETLPIALVEFEVKLRKFRDISLSQGVMIDANIIPKSFPGYNPRARESNLPELGSGETPRNAPDQDL